MHCNAIQVSAWNKAHGIGGKLAVYIDNSLSHVGILVRTNDNTVVHHLWPAPGVITEGPDTIINKGTAIPVNVHEALEDSARIIISRFCEKQKNAKSQVSAKHTAVSYSFAFDTECQLDEMIGFTGNHVAGDGLTCAGFVADLFHIAGIHLVNKASWKPRDEDRMFFMHRINKEIECAANDPARAQELEVQKSRIDGKRLRPIEIAAAAGCCIKNMAFDQAEYLAEHLKDTLQPRPDRPHTQCYGTNCTGLMVSQDEADYSSEHYQSACEKISTDCSDITSDSCD